jgi:SpoVK/Ycf46/Vps4 family AAA+-type ATPase
VQSSSILLIEDIDTYFDGRNSGTKINFSTFINEISGVKAKEDIILFITTNHKNKIDEALMRSGRLDMHFEISYPTAKEVNEYLNWFYSQEIYVASDPITYTMADVENVCLQNKFNYMAAINELRSTMKIKIA